MTANAPIRDAPTFTTVDAFLNWAGAQPETRYELVDGEAVMTPGGSFVATFVERAGPSPLQAP